MERLKLNNIYIQIDHQYKNSKYIKLKFLQEQMKDINLQRNLFIFLYNLFIECVLKGNNIIFINDDAIYLHKDKKMFRYYGSDI